MLDADRSQATALEPPYLSALNPMQRAAVEAVDGPVLVLAGAGTGKTRVLTTRLAHIVSTGRAAPWRIIAVTFTNKAAREMRDRSAALLGRSVEGWWVGTFHAIAARMVRENAERVGLRSSFTILDADDQLRLIKQLSEARKLDLKRYPPRAFSIAIQRWKDRGLLPARVTAAEGADALDGLALPLYEAYQERLATLNAADFGDLLLHSITLFTEHRDVLSRYQRQFQYLLVDEYQDANVAQYLWLRALAQEHRNLCCVGDDDQSIYSWRGAEISNILRFEQDFPGAQVIRLECNYRSTPQILAAASSLIARNRARLGKTLWTPMEGGENVVVRAVWDGEDEARVLCEEVEALQAKGERLQSMAVLVRAGFQTREFEERLITVGLPYRIVGGARFYERQEIRDAIAYFRITVQPDDDLAFERIMNTPKRGLGAASLKTLHEVARGRRCSLLAAAARLIETDDLRPQTRASLRRLLDDIGRWRRMLTATPHSDVARAILDESGYAEMWKTDRSPEAQGRLENLKELVAALAEFESLGGFLEHVSLVMENEEAAGDDKITLMTLHAAKGLEFDTVFLPGWERGLFPNQRALDEGGMAALEEERRLAYVGLTRARRRVVISHASSRMIYGMWQTASPSPFLDELPAECVERAPPSGVREADAVRTPFLTELEEAGPALHGWDRWRGRIRGTLIEGVATRVVERSRSAATFEVDQRVFHQKFGYGVVRAVDADRIDIAFEQGQARTVLASFVEPA